MVLVIAERSEPTDVNVKSAENIEVPQKAKLSLVYYTSEGSQYTGK